MASNSSAALRIIFGADTSQFDSALQQSLTKLEKTSKGLTSAGKSLSVGLTAPLTAIAATSIHTATGFEHAMAKVKAVSRATQTDFENLRTQALDLGRTTVFTAQDVANLQLEFSKLGFTAPEIQKVTEATLYLAQATGSELAQAAEVAGSTLRGFGLKAEETVRVTDVMALSFSSSALDLENFRESMKYVAPVAKSAGVSLEQTTAMLGILANAGIKGSQAGTSLRRIISDLGASGKDTKTAIAELAAKGLDLADAKDEVGRTAQTALLVLSEGVGQVDSLTTSLQGAEGASAQMAQTMNATTYGSLKSMESAVEGAQIAIGNALAPTVQALAKIVGDAALAFSSLSEDTRNTIIAVAGAAAAIGPLLLAAGGMIAAYGKIKIALQAYQLAQLKANLAALANPYVAIGVAVAAAAAAFYLYANNVSGAEGAHRRLNKAKQNAIDQTATEAAKVNALLTQYKHAATDLNQRKRIIEELNKISPQYFGNLNAETTGYHQLSQQVNAYTKQLRAAAIEKAFGEELTEVEAERIKTAEELFQAQQKLAVATENRNQLERDYNAGQINWLTYTAKVANYQAAVDGARIEVSKLTREEKDLAAESDKVAQALTRAQKAAGLTGAAPAVTPAPAPIDPVTPATPLGLGKPDPETKRTIEDVKRELAEALEAGRITQLINPDEATRLKDLTRAYEEAARGAYQLKEVTLAEKYSAEAKASRDLATALDQQGNATAEVVTAEQEIQNTLQDRIDDISALTFAGATLEETNAATAEAFRDAAKAAALLGNPELAAEYLKQADAIYLMGKAAEETEDKVMATFETFAEQVVNGIEQAVTSSIAQIGELIGAAAAAGTPLQGVGQALAGIGADLLTTLGQIAIQVGKTTIATGTAIEAIKKALKNFQGGVAIAAGIALVALGAIAKGALANAANPPALAQGGITTGPTLALIGDNPSGKEAVIPFERMGEFLSMAGAGASQSVIVTGRISGSDIVLSNERGSRDRNRRR